WPSGDGLKIRRSASKRRGLIVTLILSTEKWAGHILSDIISTINRGKAVFDDIYTMNDPRSYYSVLGALDYMIPDVAEPVIRQLLDARAGLHGHENVVLDIGCSYGINAAIHRFPTSFGYLHQRYARREMMELEADELIAL